LEVAFIFGKCSLRVQKNQGSQDGFFTRRDILPPKTTLVKSLTESVHA
jgi:hypothetical protein